MGRKKAEPVAAAATSVPPPESGDMLKTDAEVLDIAELREKSKRWSLTQLLAEPFPENAVKLRPTNIEGIDRAIAYVHVHHYYDRLDFVFGTSGWSVEYKINNLSVECVLSVEADYCNVTKVGIGTLHSSMGADPITMASDEAFRNACATLGIGRYLARLPAIPYVLDGSTIVTTFKLPAWAIPKNPPPEQKLYFRTFDRGDHYSNEFGAKQVEKAKPAAAATPPNGQPKPEPKPELKKEAPKESAKETEVQTIERLTREWTAHIDNAASPEELTALMKGQEWKSVPQFARQSIWDFILQTIPDTWDFDRKTNSFFSNHVPGEAIPF